RDAGHRPVVVHDLADDACGVEPREPGEVDRGLGLARPLESSALARSQREDVSGLNQILRPLARVDRHLDRAGAVVRRDPRRDSLARLVRNREGRTELRLVSRGHRPELELGAALLGEAEADQAATVRRHEVDRLGRRELGRDRQVALVFAVGRVHDDDELALANVLDRFLDLGEGGGSLDSFHLAAHRTPHRAASRSTYFARTSTSRFTVSPASSPESVVSRRVCGTSAIATPWSSASAIVSETPSTARDPFSTQ